MKWNKFERKYIPNIRHNKLYIVFKYIVIIPIIFLIYFINGLHTMVVDKKTTQVRGLKCGKCGCPLSAKVRAPQDACPIGKW